MQDDASKLELAAAEMAQAAAELVTLERVILELVNDGAEQAVLRGKEAGRVEVRTVGLGFWRGNEARCIKLCGSCIMEGWKPLAAILDW